MSLTACVPALLALILSPLTLGVINKTKARFGGRVGPPWTQAYRDLFKLFGKGAVYSRVATWVVRVAPMVNLSVALVAATLVPLGGLEGVSFSGDLILLVCVLGLGRFFMVAAALDTGSPFEGMGASREVFFAALAEPALLLGLAAVERETGRQIQDANLARAEASVDSGAEPEANSSQGGRVSDGPSGSNGLLSLRDMHENMTTGWRHGGLVMILVAVTLMVTALAENSRIPVDDPNTHLELTMIHEVIVLDHGGPDLAFILLAKSIKLWVFSALLVGILLPWSLPPAWGALVAIAGVFAIAAIVGVVESTMARLRMPRVPQLLIGANAMAGLALVLEYR